MTTKTRVKALELAANKGAAQECVIVWKDGQITDFYTGKPAEMPKDKNATIIRINLDYGRI